MINARDAPINQANSGKGTKWVMPTNTKFLVLKKGIADNNRRIIIGIGNSPVSTPIVVDCPRPPLNLAKIGKICPRTTANPQKKVTS